MGLARTNHIEPLHQILPCSFRERTLSHPNKNSSDLTMASSTLSFYETYLDCEYGLMHYLSPDGHWLDTVSKPLQQLERAFASGPSNRRTLIVYGMCHIIPTFLPACDHFEQIVFLECLNKNIQFIEKWLKSDPEEFGWSALIKSTHKNEEEWNKLMEREKTLKEKINQVLKAELTESGLLTSLPLPPADCLYSTYGCPCLCEDKDYFSNSVKNMSSLLKVGGHLVMHVPIQCTFFWLGEVKFPVLCITEEDVRKVLRDQGFVIKEEEYTGRVDESKHSETDYSGIMFVVACKLGDAQ